MKKYTKSNCLVRRDKVGDDCNLEESSFRTEQPNNETIIFEVVKKYIENTVEVTRTVRVPKGAYCNNCSFKKHEYSLYSNLGCCGSGSGYVSCALYGARLEIDKEMSLVTAMLPDSTLTFYKCAQCLIDTKND